MDILENQVLPSIYWRTGAKTIVAFCPLFKYQHWTDHNDLTSVNYQAACRFATPAVVLMF